MPEIGPTPSMTPSQPSPSAPGMPEPQPVFDVSSQHVWAGRVEFQKYVFLWVACAFFLGAILSWRGPAGAGGMNLMQALICLLSLPAIWGMIVVIRGRRAMSAALFLVEFVALFSVVIHYSVVSREAKTARDAKLDSINISISNLNKEFGGKAGTMAESKLLSAEWERVEKGEAWGLGDIFAAPIAIIKKAPDDLDRVRAEAAWNSFGTGFYLTVLASAFFVLYFIFVIIRAVSASKKKDAAAPAAGRPARRPRDAGDAAKLAAGKETAKSGEAAKPDAK